MNTNVVCDKCQHNNVVGKGNLKQEEVVICRKGEGNVLNIIYFVCLECKSIVVVQIDNKETLKIKESLSRTIMQAVETKREGGKVGKKLNSKRIRLTESLDKKREKLLEKYKKEVEKVLTEN